MVKKAVVLLDHTRIRQRGPDRTETETRGKVSQAGSAAGIYGML